MAGSSESSKSLEQTPTYAFATIVFIFVTLSYLLERGLHYLGQWVRKRYSKPLADALEIMKEELMLLGFISVLLTLFQDEVAKVCVPVSRHMLPCSYISESKSPSYGYTSPPETSSNLPPSKDQGVHRRLLGAFWPSESDLPSNLDISASFRRSLAGSSSGNSCSEGKEPFVSAEGIHQLHMFIFILAIVHLIYSCVTLLLALYKIHRWKAWEVEAHELSDKCSALSTEDKIRLMKTKRTSTFVRRHEPVVPAVSLGAVRKGLSMAGWKHQWLANLEKGISHWLTSFFAQFWNSVGQVDYRTLRMAFVHNHNLEMKFDFHSYLIRSMESDFTHVIGTSYLLWMWVVLVLALNVQGWNFLFWIDLVPIALALLVGTKLEHVMARLAEESADAPALCVGQSIKARDDLFWLNRPKLLLHILHFVIFQNSFQLAIFFWYLGDFGARSCLFGNWWFVAARLFISVFVQFLCSYISLPLYCLVTQMGSHFKKAMFSEQVNQKLSEWAERHKKVPSGGAIPEPVVEVASRIHSTLTENTSRIKEAVRIVISSDSQSRKASVANESVHTGSTDSMASQVAREAVKSEAEGLLGGKGNKAVNGSNEAEIVEESILDSRDDMIRNSFK